MFQCKLCNRKFKLFRNLLRHIYLFGLSLSEYRYLIRKIEELNAKN